jgi:hypothetical protein
MFAKSDIEVKLDAEIETLLSKLESITDKKSTEYAQIVERLSELHKLRPERSKRVSPDTMLIVAANIFGILWVARYEREKVIKSRSALGLIMKPR